MSHPNNQPVASSLQLQTERLILRRWKPEDLLPFAEINADPAVMEYFPQPLTLEQTQGLIERIETRFDTEGFGLWATTLAKSGELIGFVGLSRPTFSAHFTPCVEIGWRLARKHWGKAYAGEGAVAALADGFNRLQLPEIVSFTARINTKSIRVMQKLGMKNSPDEDFMHPLLPDGERLRPHVLYRISANQFAHCQKR